MVSGPISQLKYRVQVDSSAVGFKVIRNSDNVTLMDTQNVGGLILSDKFLQISSLLPSEHIYGLGEKQAAFLNDLNWKTITLFNRDIAPTENVNLYGSQPFYLSLERSGRSHGVLLLNTNAMDIVLQPTPAITYRALGGILDFTVFLGPTPQDVVAQYTARVGRPFMPPYWSLGFHLCKYNYGSLNVTREVMESNRKVIPLDVQWNDLDYMGTANDFSYDKDKFAGLPQFVAQLHDKGMHYVILLDPGVSASEKAGEYPPFDRGLEMDIFIKNSSDQPFVGKVWNPVSTVWPDFTHPKAFDYWRDMMMDFHEKVKYDGVWIDMNEPSNFLSGSMYGDCEAEELPYKPVAVPEEGLKYKTLCMDAKHYGARHYDVHNVYALAEAIVTHQALSDVRDKRPFIISRASFPSLGRWAGHWSGDVFSRWHDMRMSIPALLSFSIFGVPMMGTDICGFNEDTTVELCKRWMQLGAFYPFSRNHNTINARPQDPVSLGPEVVAASRSALLMRYRLLPYYYTLFWRAHLYGDTVARPMFFEFPSIKAVYAIDTQFLIGANVLISAILTEGANTTRALFPGPDPWYSFADGRELATNDTLDIGDTDIVSIRGGAILPLQEPPAKGPVNTAITRSAPLQLLVVPDSSGGAKGELYWDDGDSINTYEEKKYRHIEFEVKDNQLTSVVQWWGYGVPSINTITILGQNPISTVKVNDVTTNFTYNKHKVLTIAGINLGCHTCGSKGCNRHDPEMSAEPWTGLHIHKQLDQAIEDFYNTILEQFINTWYSKITLQPFFVDELRHQLRYASACLIRRALKINYSQFICSRLVPCALRHYSVWSSGARPALHVAASNRTAELRYLRCVTESLLPHLLRSVECQNTVFRVLIREIFAGWVLLSLTDVLADPYILNTLIVLATGDETMANLPATPNYKVEFLENFVRQTESVYGARAKLLRIDLELLLNNQEHFYALLHHLKTTTDIYLLQFYKDIKSFQTRILNPELTSEEKQSLYQEARELFSRYMSSEVPRVELPDALLAELEELLEAGPEGVTRLQTSRALYQAARQSHSALEKIMLPKFLHSEEFYKLYIGPRIPIGYQKQMTKRPQDKLNMLKLGLKLKNVLKPQVIDGQILESIGAELEDGESLDNVDILKYLDSLAADDTMDQDLSAYKVVLTNVETRLQPPPRRGSVRVFTLTVHRVREALPPALFSVERSEHDFHLLRGKLQEFHGDALLADLPLPSRRDNSPLETLRYKYEDFLQRLIQINLLQTSELVHLFLTVDGDFSMLVQASTLNAAASDLGNIYQSVAHKLRKEKGQHLESFLRNFLISSDKERYQALKQGTTRDIEEAHEVEVEETHQLTKRPTNARNIRGSVFQNNFDMEPVVMRCDLAHQDTVVGFSQCLMYMLSKVIKARALVTGVVGNLVGMSRILIDTVFNILLNSCLCNLLNERRLAHLIRLGHGILFGKKSSPRTDPGKQRQLARHQLLLAIPPAASLALGPGLPSAALVAFELIQNPQLNKQLVYNLLDLCIIELFPELSNTESNIENS
ncbi:sorting nexin-14 [Bicyclus anynana]|uniref:Sorting nexin-14 n=1 Tax=Bicyclus anynana TaxID=110368 RepID=A0A6J1NEQ4_BICAN|nr:sorting nexin-14 [Bicyclus anynana]